MNRKLEDDWAWIIKVIRSCETFEQLNNCPRLVNIFWKNNHIPLRLTMSNDEININSSLSVMVNDLNDEILRIHSDHMDVETE